METNIAGLVLKPLKQILDERGGVFHFLRNDSDTFNGFGEAYYSKIAENVVKGWKYHSEIHQNFCVPYGAVELVIYDERNESPSYGNIEKVSLNDKDQYFLLSMPPKLWYSFKCISKDFALMANIIDQPHKPQEAKTLPIDTDEIPYKWAL